MLALVVIAVAVQQGSRRWLERASPTADAEWIWALTKESEQPLPRVVVFARDFSLHEAPPQARLAVQVDEEYRIFLNGRFLGGNRYRQGEPLDVYEVAEVLVTGGNRLVIEGRSGRGGGGALASLVAGADGEELQPVVGTDASWSQVESLDLGTLRGWAPLPAPGGFELWGRPPIGRWGRLRLGPPRPILPVLATAGADIRAKSIVADEDHGATFLITWPTVQTGILTLEMTRGSTRLGQIQEALEEPLNWDEVAKLDVIASSSSVRWQDVAPRRFRILRVRGLTGLTGALVRPVEEATFPASPPPREAVRGVFGLEIPDRPSRVDVAVAAATGD